MNVEVKPLTGAMGHIRLRARSEGSGLTSVELFNGALQL
jgi:hypothetical protein